MNIKELKLIENRFERKYTLLAGENWKFQNYLLSNGFIRTFDTRLVNSIYYDNDEKRFFHENIDGVSERIKTRLRWYNNDFTVKLELKKKSNAVAWKQTYFFGKFKSFSEFRDFYQKNENLIKISHLSGLLIKPTLLIRYVREYWESSCKNFRATIDNNIEYKSIELSNSNTKGLEANVSVLEFKYLSQRDNNFRKIINKTDFPFRMTKHSKYVSAVIHLKNLGAI